MSDLRLARMAAVSLRAVRRRARTVAAAQNGDEASLKSHLGQNCRLVLE